MSWLDLLRDPLLRSAALTLWLLPCKLQDYRTRHVTNWLTVPLFILAWPAALLMAGNLLLTFAVFVGVVVAWRWGGGMGPADGKLMVGIAACAPLALGIGALLEVVVFASAAAARPTRYLDPWCAVALGGKLAGHWYANHSQRSYLCICCAIIGLSQGNGLVITSPETPDGPVDGGLPFSLGLLHSEAEVHNDHNPGSASGRLGRTGAARSGSLARDH